MKEPFEQLADEPYVLTNLPPCLPESGDPQPETESTRQRVLFSGMDCLPGQRNLFETDGEDQ